MEEVVVVVVEEEVVVVVEEALEVVKMEGGAQLPASAPPLAAIFGPRPVDHAPAAGR